MVVVVVVVDFEHGYFCFSRVVLQKDILEAHRFLKVSEWMV